ncbi:MAG TPA: hypothetical protein VHH34_12975, partial [Pseudonocardiaceae bacterium]|nr:hypothetical protein [Pseudonocardiaceae bacterium]
PLTVQTQPVEVAPAPAPPAQEITPGPGTDLPFEAGEAAPADLAAGPSPGAADAPVGGAPPGGAGTAGAAGSPEELVKKLFDPLLRRIKTELRLDRERRGMLTDLRH